jgi:hypothetical protein
MVKSGGPILEKTSDYSGLVFLHAATLETPELFNPEKVFGVHVVSPGIT